MLLLLLTELLKKLLNYPMFTKGKDDPVQLFHNIKYLSLIYIMHTTLPMNFKYKRADSLPKFAFISVELKFVGSPRFLYMNITLTNSAYFTSMDSK